MLLAQLFVCDCWLLELLVGVLKSAAAAAHK